MQKLLTPSICAFNNPNDLVTHLRYPRVLSPFFPYVRNKKNLVSLASETVGYTAFSLSCWVNFQCRGVLLIWIIVGQGPAVLAVGADGVVWTFFLSSIILSSFSLCLGDDPRKTEMLPQRTVKPKTTNQTSR